MKARLLLAAVLVLASQAVAGDGVSAQRRAAAARAPVDWTRTAVVTPEGGVRVGNPNAPVKVIEFFSPPDPHASFCPRPLP